MLSRIMQVRPPDLTRIAPTELPGQQSDADAPQVRGMALVWVLRPNPFRRSCGVGKGAEDSISRVFFSQKLSRYPAWEPTNGPPLFCKTKL